MSSRPFTGYGRVLVYAWLGFVLARAAFVRADEPDGGAADEHAAYTPRPSDETGEHTLAIDAPKGAPVVRIPIEGTVDLGLTALIERAVQSHPDAAATVLDINTLGGRVDAAIRIRDTLLESRVKTIAYVHPRAISAGALIALACDFIVFSNGASMGAATPIQLGEGGAKPVEEKMVSYFRTEMRATAEAKGRRGDIAEAMVDASVSIEGVVPAGKLLTLDSKAALEWHMADFAAGDLNALLTRLGLDGRAEIVVEENWAERVVRFLTDPVVSSLLMSLGTLGILIELYTPGFGIPGMLGVLCLSLFFGGHLLVHLAGLEELILLSIGFVALGLEVFVIPGFGVAGVTGIVCIVAALVLSLTGLPLGVVISTSAWVEPLGRVMAALLMTLVGMLVALRILPRTRAGKSLVLSAATTRTGGFVSSDESRFLGRVGTADPAVRPVGGARFGDERVDVISEGDYVAKGRAVKVVTVEGARIVVRVVENDV